MHTQPSLVPVPTSVAPAALRLVVSPRGLARLATQALIDEATLTPKPGLVDRRGPGAHHDLTLDLLLQSSKVLLAHFVAMAEAALTFDRPILLRERLGALGRAAERGMLQATGGINTHRGAIWSLGLLVAAAVQNPHATPESICTSAGRLAALPDRHAPATLSHGRQAGVRFGATGARGEAVAGFPHICLHSLPALRVARAQGLPETTARLHSMLALLATLPDTCLLYRGGVEALEITRTGAARTLAFGGFCTTAGRIAFNELDQTLLQLWASPGGSADLLAATLFLDSLAQAQATTRDSRREPND